MALCATLRLLGAQEQDPPPKSPGRELMAQGRAALESGAHAKAEKLLRKAHALLDRADPEGTVECERWLAQGLDGLERPAEALELHRRVLAADREQLGEGHPDVADDLNRLGRCQEQLGRHDQAVASWEAALVVARHLGLTPMVADLTDAIGECLRAQGRHRDAVEYLQQAVKAYGSQWEVLRPRMRLARCYVALGRLKDARLELERGKARVLKEGPGVHPIDVAMWHLELGAVLRALEEAPAAAVEFGAALAAWRKATDFLEGYLDDIFRTGVGLRAVARPADAAAAFELLVQACRKMVPPSYELHALALNRQASCLLDLDQGEAALVCHRQSVEVYRTWRGPEHEDVAVALTCVGSTLVRLGRVAEALPVLDEARQLRGRLPANDPKQHASLLRWHAQALDQVGRGAEAAACRDAAQRLWPETRPAASQPAGSQPASAQPAASQPAGSQPARPQRPPA